MSRRVPPVEISDHGHPLGIGRPDRKTGSLLRFVPKGMSAHFFIQAEIAALVEEEKIVILKQGDVIPDRILGFPGHCSSLISFFYPCIYFFPSSIFMTEHLGNRVGLPPDSNIGSHPRGKSPPGPQNLGG